jgi:hypothetical protein
VPSKSKPEDQTTHSVAITMAQPIFNLIDYGQRQEDGCSSCSHGHTNEVESACAHHNRKMDGVLLSTMAVWMNAAHPAMGGDIIFFAH